MTLPEIEEQIWKLLGNLDFRRTLRKVVAVGDLMNLALERLSWEDYKKWVVRFHLQRRTEELYRQGANICAEQPEYLDRFANLNRLLTFFRMAKRRAWQEKIAENRQAAIDADLPPEKQYRVMPADCREYKWPPIIDCIATDPPWTDMDAYKWLGRFAKGHLKEGGLLLTQCSHAEMPVVLDILRGADLKYQWTLAIVYQSVRSPTMLPPFVSNWRPMLVFSKGMMNRKGIPVMSDTQTLWGSQLEKTHHVWQQPLKPWVYWLKGLTAPGSLTADPFCGSATTGVALKTTGNRRYLGTDINADTVKIARARLKNTDEGDTEKGRYGQASP